MRCGSVVIVTDILRMNGIQFVTLDHARNGRVQIHATRTLKNMSLCGGGDPVCHVDCADGRSFSGHRDPYRLAAFNRPSMFCSLLSKE